MAAYRTVFIVVNNVNDGDVGVTAAHPEWTLAAAVETAMEMVREQYDPYKPFPEEEIEEELRRGREYRLGPAGSTNDIRVTIHTTMIEDLRSEDIAA